MPNPDPLAAAVEALWEGVRGCPSRPPCDTCIRTSLLAAAPALLAAIVGAMERTNGPTQPERIEVASSEQEPCKAFVSMPPIRLLAALTAALGRLA